MRTLIAAGHIPPAIPKSGDRCPECANGVIRTHTSPGGARHRWCSHCPVRWMLPNLFARKG